MESQRAARWAAVAFGSVIAILLAWWLDATGRDVPTGVSRLLVAWGALWIVGGLVAAVRRGLGSENADDRAAMWMLLGLVAAALAARWVGLAFELTTHFHNDEGIFLKVGGEMLAGDLLPTQFHYPHLLYYLSSITLWVSALFPGLVAKVAGWGWGVPAADAPILMLRIVSATLGALTVVPVFTAARRVAGPVAALFAGGLIALSPTYNEVAQLAISDVPSGFFAALTLAFVARLARRERLRDYLLAGIAAGLAAASKYPAGVSAIAIVGVWAYWRLRRRDFNLLLLWAGLISLATLLAVMPALWLRFEAVFGGPGESDILFGYRQYAGRGWIGVVTDSNVLYYARGLGAAFGFVGLVAGAIGVFLLPADARRRALVMAVFPTVFLALLIAMNVAVKRNLQPLLPAVAIVLGAGLTAWLPLVPRPRGGWKVAALAALVLAQPAFATVAWDIGRVRPGTRELALEWIEANVPQGAGFVKEAYTPNLHFRRHAWLQARYAARLTLEEIRDPRWDYLLLARNAHLRFLDPDKRLHPHHEIFAERYRRMFDELELLRRFSPGLFRSGPDLLLYRIDPPQRAFFSERRFTVPEDVTWVSDPALEPADGGASVRFFRKGQSVVFKEYLAPGSYRATLNEQPSDIEAWLYVVSRDNREIGRFPSSRSKFEFDLDRADKYLLRVFLSPGAELRTLELAAVTGD